ncbi:MAG: CheR family methyltransferase [Gemmataceae bacterium]
MNLTALEKLLHDRIGLDVESIGAATLPRVVAARMQAHGSATPEHYTAYVAGSPTEWTALVGELVVPETWFFRGGIEFFEHLAKWVRTRLAESANGRTLRALSVPCSTGEEPYSLAIALDREGIPAARCTIDGVDLSRDHLLRAVAARYPAFSFREANADPRPDCFTEREPGKWELHREFRDRVQFRPGNAVEPGFLAAEPPYDLILCRNLFIYLSADGAARAMANLERLLAPDGLLCLTAAEADRIPVARFVPDGPASFAIFKKYTGDVPLPPRSGVIKLPATKPPSGVFKKPAASGGRLPADPSPAIPVPHQGADAPRSPDPDPLREGRRLADAGKLDAARAACEAAPNTAARFSLLGVIHLAAGRGDEATDAFRKALYLNPDDPEALTHMAVLCEQRGEADQAACLRRRLAKGAT